MSADEEPDGHDNWEDFGWGGHLDPGDSQTPSVVFHPEVEGPTTYEITVTFTPEGSPEVCGVVHCTGSGG